MSLKLQRKQQKSRQNKPLCSVIEAIARKGNYIVFVFSRRHAQVYDLTAMVNGTPKEFCKFIEEKTGLEIKKI